MIKAFSCSLFLSLLGLSLRLFRLNLKIKSKSYQILEVYRCSPIPPFLQSFCTLHITLSL